MLEQKIISDVKADVAANIVDSGAADLDVKIVGEHDGSLVFTCKKNENVVIGLYEWITKDTKVLCTLERNCDIIQACVKHDHSCLAFVTQQQMEDFSEIHAKGTLSAEYEVYMVIINDGKVECSGMCVSSEYLLQVEFCQHMTMINKSGNDCKPCFENQILVFNVNSGIDLYNCRFNDGALDCTKMKTLAKDFMWAQWLPKNRCLFFIHFRESNTHHDGFNIEYKNPHPMLKCLQFHDDVHYETVLTLPLEIGESVIPSSCSHTGVFVYDPVKHLVSGNKFYLEVLTRAASETFYICYQFVSTNDDEHHESTLKLHYSIVLLHHGKCLNCEINNLPKEYENGKMFFVCHSSNYVLAYMPGLFSHLLDVGPEHEPFSGTHILVPDSFTNQVSSVKSFVSDHSFLSHDMQLVSLSVQPESLVQYLKKSQHTSTRRAIVHYISIHTKYNAKLLKLVLQTLLEAPDRLDVVSLFQEFLTGHTHTMCKQVVKKDFLKLFPITLGELFGRQIEQVSDNEQIQITLSNVASTENIMLSPSQRLKLVSGDIWLSLWNHSLLEACRKFTRFSPAVLKDRLMLSTESSLQSETSSTCSSSSSDEMRRGFNGIFMETIADNARSVNDSAVNGSTGVNLPFSEKSDYGCNQLERIQSMNLQEMSIHILKHHADDLPFLIHKTAVEYVYAQMQSSRILCSLLCGFEIAISVDLQEEILFSHDLWKDLPKSNMRRLFSLMEKFQIACSEIASPVPRGFLPFISLLGFKCLDYRMYLQYIDRGGLQLLPEVAEYIMNESDEDDDVVKLKMEILLRLPRSRAWGLIELWDHPKSVAIQAREHSRVMHSLTTMLESS